MIGQRPDTMPSTHTTACSAEEMELLRLWRSTDDRGRKFIMNAVESQQGWDSTGRFQIVTGGRKP